MITLRCPAKINLTLDILGKDQRVGKHFLNTVFYLTQELQDVLHLEKTHSDDNQLSCDHPEIPVDHSNTVIKVLDLLGEKGWKIRLEKRIPPRAGLGGGSSNAGTLLKYLGRQRGLPDIELERMAQEIGADVPVFLSEDNLVYCEGFGDEIVKSWSIAPLPIEIHLTDAQVSTPEAFARLDLSSCGHESVKTEALLRHLDATATITEKDLKPFVHNDFEVSFFAAHPELKGKGQLCGSGGTLWTWKDHY